MRWWILFLQMCNRKMPRPDLDEKAPVWVIPIWSDAAGAHWYPMGMVQDVLYFHPYGGKGSILEGERLDRKLSALELT